MLNRSIVLAVLLAAIPHLVSAEGVWGKVKEGASSAATAVSDTAKSLTTEEAPEESRNKIDAMAAKTLKRLFAERKGAKELYDKSHGYAVFDTRKFSVLITTGFGGGVAVERESAKRTYMKMATGGVNVGLGGQFYQLVFLFENKAKFDNFVNDGFEAGASAGAVAGKESEELVVRYSNGVAVFQLTEKGLLLAADLTGTRYWKNSDLN